MEFSRKLVRQHMAKRVKPLLKAAVAGLCLCSPVPLTAQDIGAIADSATVRVEPSRFDQLPTEIIRYLVDRGCTIPQSPFYKGLQNVVAGEFRRRGQQDWAVLCSVDATSRILVFFGGSLTDIAELAATDDRIYLQGIGNGEIWYSRRLQVAHAEYIRWSSPCSVDR